ncbi:MAG: hypothetical protein JW734_07195 [Candidatus Omnitrophica bacterium]|nr:hypothetical protein [Candidatus Omnitrophota bacterium]
MDLREKQKEIIELLASHEEIIAKLYKTYAEKFPANKQFWTVLHLEELDHASWIRRLFPRIEEGVLSFNENRFKAKIIKESFEHVEELIRLVQTKELTLMQALATGIDIEQSLIESKFFEVYESDSHELKQLLLSLQEAFLEHSARLKEALKKRKSIKSS